MANLLSGEKSPYLLQHKDNPVDWHPWGREAFDMAQAEDKPIFLSIGYSTCHWCHVMAHESFEDEDVAQLLREYVCVKVDREERPDVDAVYMAVCQAMTGSGGWPLTIVMTPEQKPFFAGTYFPKKDRYGQPGLERVLRQITRLWRENREALLEAGDRCADILRRDAAAQPGQPDVSLLHEGLRQLSRSFDERWGGFGTPPKFPTPHNLLFLMRMHQAENQTKALRMAETTLRAMAAGGIFDAVAGGFARYSTDEKWLVPHFEKMLYDNALLLIAYTEAFQLTRDAFYADVARRTAEYILQELTSPEGGFYCGQDADSDGVEGKYYVFIPEEVTRALGERDGRAFCQAYGITPRGHLEGRSIPNRIGRDGAPWSADDPRLKRLAQYRKARARLHLDCKMLLSWNAWTIAALARAGLVLKEARYTAAAQRAQRFVSDKMTDGENRLFLRYCDGEVAHAGQLEDYAVYALSLLQLYGCTLETRYLREAVLRARQMIRLFEDGSNGGYYMTAHDAEALIARPKETYDGALPSGNSVAQMVLETLARLTGEEAFREAADRQHRFMAGQISAYPAAHSFSLLAMAKALYPHRELLCAGAEPPKELWDYLRAHPAHDVSVLFQSPHNRRELVELAPFTAAYPPSELSVWYLCENGACRAPQTDFSALGLA